MSLSVLCRVSFFFFHSYSFISFRFVSLISYSTRCVCVFHFPRFTSSLTPRLFFFSYSRLQSELRASSQRFLNRSNPRSRENARSRLQITSSFHVVIFFSTSTGTQSRSTRYTENSWPRIEQSKQESKSDKYCVSRTSLS